MFIKQTWKYFFCAKRLMKSDGNVCTQIYIFTHNVLGFRMHRINDVFMNKSKLMITL